MTLKDQIAADAANVFLNEDEFAETVTRQIGGDSEDAVPLTAIVAWDTEPGRNEFSGEGATTEDSAGQSLRRNCWLEVAVADCDPNELQPEHDRFLLADGTQVTFLRSEGRDNAMATLLCYVNEHQSSFRPRLRPR